MFWPVVIAWIHYVSIMLVIASVLGEHLLLKPELSAQQARTLQRLDSIYGAAAGLLLATGVARMYLEKGVAYYIHNSAFDALVATFAIAGLLSIYPTVVFLGWRTAGRAGQGQALAASQFKQLQMTLRAEIVLLLLAPLFATLMAHGAAL